MSKSTIRLLTAICATALMVVSTVTAASAGTSSRQQFKKHHKLYRAYNSYRGYGRPADQAWSAPGPSSPSGDVCPGIARSFECKIWPPPIDQDPDRKMSGSDGM